MKGIKHIFPLAGKSKDTKKDEPKIIFLAQERVVKELSYAVELLRLEAKNIARDAIAADNPKITKHLLEVAINSMEVADLLEGVRTTARATFELNNEAQDLAEPYLEYECEEDI